MLFDILLILNYSQYLFPWQILSGSVLLYGSIASSPRMLLTLLLLHGDLFSRENVV